MCHLYAGVGAAWRWQGPGGGGFDSAVVKQMQRFLAADQPRVRVLGGTRWVRGAALPHAQPQDKHQQLFSIKFQTHAAPSWHAALDRHPKRLLFLLSPLTHRYNPEQAPAPEWQPLGAYMFVLPLVEYSEVEGGGLLAVTLAWDAAAGHHQHDGVQPQQQRTPGLGSTPLSGTGACSAAVAGDAVASALQRLLPPTPPAAPAAHVSHGGEPTHCPPEPTWHKKLAELLDALGGGAAEAAAAAAQNGGSSAGTRAGAKGPMQGQHGGMGAAPSSAAGLASPLAGLDIGLAWQEYTTNGQQVGPEASTANLPCMCRCAMITRTREECP